MGEEEILIRAREAAIKVGRWTNEDVMSAVRRGQNDDVSPYIQCAVTALRDLSKPLSEIQPVDPDLVEARRIWADLSVIAGYSDMPIMRGDMDEGDGVKAALAAIKRGRELAVQS